MFCVTNFGLVLLFCIVNAMIFIFKFFDKLVQDQFLQIVKIINMINFAMLEKIGLVFFSGLINKFLVIKYPRMCVQAY